MAEKSKIEWIEIPNYNGYLISKEGRIFSIKTNKLIKHLRNKTKHHYVFLYDGYGKSKKEYVHRLVLTTFVGTKKYPEFECRHIDGNPDNNFLENLEWGSKSINQRDRIKHGTI